MKLTVVGCSGSFPGPESAASCYLLEHDGYAMLLDLGNGAIGPLANYINIDDINAVLLSHLHIDHCADIGPLYVSRRYHPAGMRDRIPVIGPEGIESRIINLYGCGDSPEPLHSVIDFVEFSATPLEFGPFSVEAQLVVHPVPAYALRVTAGGRTLVYSGDTAPCDELVQISRGADLALFEASYLEKNDNPPLLHLTGADAAKAATQAGVQRLVLTHLVPWNDLDEVKADAAEFFDGDLIMARPGLTLTV